MRPKIDPSTVPFPIHKTSSTISLSDLTFYPLPGFSNSPRRASDDSIQTVFNTQSKFNNSYIENPDEFFNTEPSPTSFSQTPFQPIVSQTPFQPSLSPS